MEHLNNDSKIARDEAVEVVVIGSNHLDFFVRLIGADPGWDCSVSADAMTVLPGGGGLNTSIRLAQLGITTAYVGCVGADADGTTISKALQQGGVDCGCLHVDDSRPTSRAVIIVGQDGGRKVMSYAGAAITELSSEDKELLCGAKVVHLASVHYQVLCEVVALKQQAAFKLSIDPGGLLFTATPLHLAVPLLKRVDVVSLSFEEARLLGLQAQRKDAVRLFLKSLRHLGIGLIALRMGALGSYLCTPKQLQFCKPFLVSAVDGSGSGDNFNSALIYALLKKFSLDEMGKFANALGALNATAVGGSSVPVDEQRLMDFIDSNLRKVTV